MAESAGICLEAMRHLSRTSGFERRLLEGSLLLLRVFNSQDRKPAVETNANFLVKESREISAFEIDDIRSLLEADLLTVVFFAEIRQESQLRIVRKCSVAYFIRPTSAQFCSPCTSEVQAFSS